MKVKICGLLEPEHVSIAAKLGADFVGVVFAPSRRQVTPYRASEILKDIPETTKRVGVFVNERLDSLRQIVDYCRLDVVQLHGEESVKYCQQVGCTVIKAFKVKDKSSILEIEPYQDVVDYILLDTFVDGYNGGTGKVFDWTIAEEATKYGRIILAGGLTPENVRQAIAIANPFGVDVSGGVETDGVKDAAKIEQFMKAARGNE